MSVIDATIGVCICIILPERRLSIMSHRLAGMQAYTLVHLYVTLRYGSQCDTAVSAYM
jgi:hypothetical protein